MWRCSTRPDLAELLPFDADAGSSSNMVSSQPGRPNRVQSWSARSKNTHWFRRVFGIDFIPRKPTDICPRFFLRGRCVGHSFAFFSTLLVSFHSIYIRRRTSLFPGSLCVSSAGAVSPMSSSAATGISITTSPSSDTIVDDSWRKREVDGMVDIVPSGPGQGSEYFLRSCLSRRSLSSRTWAPFFCR